MKRLNWAFLGISLLMVGCQHSSSNTVWEDTKTMGRYLHRRGKLLCNQEVDSRMVKSIDEFTGPQEDEYIALRDEDLKTYLTDINMPQSMESPGMIGSSIPGIEWFTRPSASLAKLFNTIFFDTDQYVFHSKASYQVVSNIAEYMKKHPNLYVFVVGHCDERGSEHYNLALGTRRANTIRNLLGKLGVSPNQIFTISFGKEMPEDLGHTEEAWAKNRRVEFKIYEKKEYR